MTVGGSNRPRQQRRRQQQPGTRPPYELTAEQDKALREFIEKARLEWDDGGEAEDAAPVGEDVDELDDEEEEEMLEYGAIRNRDDLVEVVDENVGAERGEEEEEEEEEENKFSAPLRRSCLAFCISLLDHQTEDSSHGNALISALAVLGIHENCKEWQSPPLYTPRLSAVIKLARMMVVQSAWQEANDSDNGDGRVWRRVRKMVDRFMVRNAPTPMSWMYDVRTYGIKIAYTTTSPGLVRWAGPDGETLSYRGIEFSMDDYRAWVHGLIGDCRQMLVEEILQVSPGQERWGELPAIGWDQLRDNPAITDPGWSFIQDPRNQAQFGEGPTAGDGGGGGSSNSSTNQWLYQRLVIGQTEGRQHRWQFLANPDTAVADKAARWSHEAAGAFGRAVGRFKEKLAVLLHVTGGGPPRVPELMSVRYCNTANGGLRNIFVQDGLMVYVTGYHKGYRQSGSLKIIHRYLPQEVGELLVYYIWLVIPFERLLVRLVRRRDRRPEDHAFIWGASASDDDDEGRVGKWTGGRLHRALRRESKMRMGVEVGVAAYRQCVQAIGNRFVKGDNFFDADGAADEEGGGGGGEDEGAGSHTWDMQFGHGSLTAAAVYGRLVFEAAQELKPMMERYRAASIRFHHFQQHASTLRQLRAGGTRRRPAAAIAEDMDAHFRRWKRVKTVDRLQMLRQLTGTADAEFRGVQERAVEAVIEGRSPLLVVMGTGAGKSAVFMLPALCTASVGEVGTTVVVVPLSALRTDMVARCRGARISAVEWDRRRPQEASVVLVTPELAVGKSFRGFLDRLRDRQRLDRVVVDECHKALDGRGNFRPQLQELGRLVTAEAQLVLLTATLPPAEAPRLFDIMQVREAEVMQLREPTVRKNVRYRVKKVEGVKKQADLIAAVVREVNRLREQFDIRDDGSGGSGGKIVVYSNSRRRTELLAEALRCNAYHGKQEDTDRKARSLARWAYESDSVIAATNALGEGIDVRGIRGVVHAERPVNLVEYAQESGRAGRDGKISEVVILDGGQRWARPETENDVGNGRARAKMEQFLSERQCRRVVLDGYMDVGSERVECEEGEERCDVCEADWGRRERQAEQDEQAGQEDKAEAQDDEVLLAAFQQQRAERREIHERYRWKTADEVVEVEELDRLLERWAGHCILCLCRRRRQIWGCETRHELGQCSAGGETARVLDQRSKSTRGKIKMQRFAGCMHCGVPQMICERWRHVEDGEAGWWVQIPGGRCQHRDGMMIELLVVMMAEDGRARGLVSGWMSRFGESEQVREAAVSWLSKGRMPPPVGAEAGVAGGPQLLNRAMAWFGQRVVLGRAEVTMLVKVFYRLATLVETGQHSQHGLGAEEEEEQQEEEEGDLMGEASVPPPPPPAPPRAVGGGNGGGGSAEDEPTVDAIRRQLSRWRDRCAICAARGRPSNHELARCGDEEGKDAQGVVEDLQARLGLVARSGCFGCRAPREVCNRWVKDDRKARGFRQVEAECQYAGVLLSAVVGVVLAADEVGEAWIRRVCEQLGRPGVGGGGRLGELAGCLKTPRVIDGCESNNLVWEFMWLTKRVGGLG